MISTDVISTTSVGLFVLCWVFGSLTLFSIIVGLRDELAEAGEKAKIGTVDLLIIAFWPIGLPIAGFCLIVAVFWDSLRG